MIRKGNYYKKKVDPSTRAMLIRKGNEFFSQKNISSAENIFIKVDYKDGLVRLGDYYYDSNNILKAAQMYFMSENASKINAFTEQCASVIRTLLHENADTTDMTYDKIIISGDKDE